MIRFLTTLFAVAASAAPARALDPADFAPITAPPIGAAAFDPFGCPEPAVTYSAPVLRPVVYTTAQEVPSRPFVLPGSTSTPTTGAIIAAPPSTLLPGSIPTARTPMFALGAGIRGGTNCAPGGRG